MKKIAVLVVIIICIAAVGLSEERNIFAPDTMSRQEGHDENRQQQRGPVECSAQADCEAENACPPDAKLGCTCTETPRGVKACIPACTTDEDCPNPPNMSLKCDSQRKLCIPADGGRRGSGDRSVGSASFNTISTQQGSDIMKTRSVRFSSSLVTAVTVFTLVMPAKTALAGSYPVVDTGQTACYDTNGNEINCPALGETLSGQDAQLDGNQPSYIDNGDGTITDLTTGLMWQLEAGEKVDWWTAAANASSVTTGSYIDWRLPTIKELYSLINFDGVTGMSAAASIPYIDTSYFDFEYGDEDAGERFIDAQYCSATEYVSTTMGGDHTIFGVNFADGRIKGYGTTDPRGGNKLFFVKYVRGSTAYGANSFVDNNDGTVTDEATGLMWTQGDSGQGMNWEQALAWVEAKNSESYLGHSDWRLPNVKELQSLLDYSRSPDTTASAAIDPIFDASAIVNEGGATDYPCYWTGTTHLDGPPDWQGYYAAYVAFGRALGWMESPPASGNYTLLDVHGAGAQRSDPKYGDSGDYPYGHGPQGDVIRIDNFVRPVRDAELDDPRIFRDGGETEPAILV